jgi:hypothetical protein
LGLERLATHAAPNGRADLWQADARYGLRGGEPGDEDEYTFETGGGTAHITQSLSTIARYARPGATAPDFQGAIGCTLDSVEGCDIIIPTYNFSMTKHLDGSLVDGAFKANLFNLTGRTNQAIFEGFAIGEVLFLGAAGGRRGRGKWQITYRFTASPNITGLTVGAITSIAKKGHEYLWIQYADFEDTSAKMLVKQPISVHIERVYDAGDYSTLGF